MRASETVGQIDAYGYASRRRDKAASGPVRGILDGVANAVGGVMAHRLGGLREAELRNELMAAGLYTLLRASSSATGSSAPSACPPRLWLAATGDRRGLRHPRRHLGAPGGLGRAVTIVRNRARRRLEQIDYELPELIDLLVVTVEAGLGFNGSLQVAAGRLDGPLGDELRLALQEQNMGLATNEALQNMLARAETPAMRSFVRSIVQGETLGVSIGEIMRNLATEMRKRRRAAAEERAQKAPIKILFPLVFLIFPSIFVVLLGPAVFQFIQAFGEAK